MHARKHNPDIDNPARRTLLKTAACTSLVLASPSLWAATNKLAPRRQLSLLNLHTGESVIATYWSEGAYVQAELDKINEVLRDHRTGEIQPIDTTLLDQLSLLHDSTGNKQPFHVISGYRSPATNLKLRTQGNGVAKKSMHMQGKAIDIRLPDTPLKQLRDAAKSLKLGGVGYYAKSDFIHVDVGRVRYW